MDLKPENVLIAQDYIVKLGDFGFITDYNSKTVLKSSIGTQG
jgi:serine/threonine protein kinase